MVIGPLPESITRELEALKLTLAGMYEGDLPLEQTQAMAAEISAIRLQLKRLAATQQNQWTQLRRRTEQEDATQAESK